MKKTFHLILISLLASILVIDCTKDDQENPTPDLGDISGVWELISTEIANTCEPVDVTPHMEYITLIECNVTVTVSTRDGYWASGPILKNGIEFENEELVIDATGCQVIIHMVASVTGTSELMEGTITITKSYDPATCGGQTDCSVESNIQLSMSSPYLSSCLDGDDFVFPMNSDYILPWPAGKGYILNNGYCYPAGGHRQQMAYDFLIPVGDTILAARDGIVRKIKQDSPDNGQGSDHNHVMIEHSDGTVAFYAHLKQESIIVNTGNNIGAGHPIALAGHSGTTDVPHLHFGVYGSYPPIEGDDRAVNFRNMEGALDCRGGLVMGEMYTVR